MSVEYRFKQLHIDIPMSVYNELKEIIPDRGLVSIILRKLIHVYVLQASAGKINPLTLEPIKHQPVEPTEPIEEANDASSRATNQVS